MSHSKHQGHMNHDQHKHQHHQANKSSDAVIYPALSYSLLKAEKPVEHSGAIRDVRLELTGDMETYNWSFNELRLSQADKIKISRGEIVRFHFINRTMMHHPIHLHGHFFKVLSGNGNHDVIKHTVDVPPMGAVTIEFAANEYKDWFFHCHNLYHAKTGMSRVVRYNDYSGNPMFDKAKMMSDEIMDTDWYYRADVSALSNHSTFDWKASNAQHTAMLELEEHYDEERSIEGRYLYRHSRWLQWLVGFETEKEEDESSESEGHLGLSYITPFSIDTEWFITSEAHFRLEAETEFQLTERFVLELEASTDGEWDIGLEYRRSPYWSLVLNNNDRSGWGVGASVTF